MAATLLLPVPLASNTIALGLLLSDPLNSSSSSFSDSTISHGPSETSIQARYKDLVAHDDEGRFLFRQSESPLSTSRDSTLLIQADELEHTSLRHAPTSFDLLREDTAAQAFFRKMALRNQPLYYIASIQKLKNPSFSRLVFSEGNVTEVSGPKIRLPMHVRRDSAMTLEDEGSNELVLGMEIRKVKAIHGSVDAPHTIEDLEYSWTYHTVGGEQLAIGLGRALEAAELRAMAGIANGEDFSDESHGEYDSEDEGFAGF